MLNFVFTQMCIPTPVMCLVQEVVQLCWVASIAVEVKPLSLSVATPLHTPVPIVRMLGFSVNTECTQVNLWCLLP